MKKKSRLRQKSLAWKIEKYTHTQVALTGLRTKTTWAPSQMKTEPAKDIHVLESLHNKLEVSKKLGFYSFHFTFFTFPLSHTCKQFIIYYK